MKINECVSACEDIITEMCGIDDPERDLNEDCVLECSSSGEWSFINGSLIGLHLISENGCDQYFAPPVLHREITVEEFATIALVCVGVLVLFAILPKPIFI